MQKFISQKENMQCDNCDSEIPHGAVVYIGHFEEYLCDSCHEEQEDEDELNLIGETYS
jgi:hypothetical protein